MRLWVTVVRLDLTLLELGFTKSQLISPQALADLRRAPGYVPLSGSKFFHFHGKNWPNNRLVPHLGGWHPPNLGILDPPLTVVQYLKLLKKLTFLWTLSKVLWMLKPSVILLLMRAQDKKWPGKSVMNVCIHICKPTLYFHITFCY